jgi:hypothetical protein
MFEDHLLASIASSARFRARKLLWWEPRTRHAHEKRFGSHSASKPSYASHKTVTYKAQLDHAMRQCFRKQRASEPLDNQKLSLNSSPLKLHPVHLSWNKIMAHETAVEPSGYPHRNGNEAPSLSLARAQLRQHDLSSNGIKSFQELRTAMPATKPRGRTRGEAEKPGSQKLQVEWGEAGRLWIGVRCGRMV